jgi:UDPglucose 6-dehydrogenase
LSDLVHKNSEAGRLHFTVSLIECLDTVEVLFLAVGTPQGEDGSADLKCVLEVAKTIGKNSVSLHGRLLNV